jgi:hypothetical protein
MPQRGVLTLLLHAKAICEKRWLRERYPVYRDYEQRCEALYPWLWQPKQNLASPSQSAASGRAQHGACFCWK